jgi:predicted PP-loop superfamily ATPase
MVAKEQSTMIKSFTCPVLSGDTTRHVHVRVRKKRTIRRDVRLPTMNTENAKENPSASPLSIANYLGLRTTVHR